MTRRIVPARMRQKPVPLVVIFTRDDEDPIRIEVEDDQKAALKAVTVILQRGRLQAGDRLTIEAAD